MCDTEYVETSDPEELEILHVPRAALPATPLQTTAVPITSVLRTPRKRRKLFHEVNGRDDPLESTSTYSQRSMSPTVDDGSITPVRSSPGPPTSTAISDDDERDLTSFPIYNDLDTIADNKIAASHVHPVSEDLLGHDDGSRIDLPSETRYDGSQDELNILSQSSQTERESRRHMDMQESITEGPPESELSNTAGMDPNRRDAKSRITDLSLPSPSQRRDGTEPKFLALNDFASQLSQSSVRYARHTSLPPSSPPRVLDGNLNSPLRSISLSPDRPESVRPQDPPHNHTNELGQLPSGHEVNIFELAGDAGDSVPTRRYSLRARQARQLNPYEYDKRLYKQQLKQIPDAIVKVVSPQRHASGHRTNRHSEDQKDDDFVVPDDEDHKTQEHKRVRGKNRRDLGGLPSNGEIWEDPVPWMPKAYHMDDDDLPPLSPVAATRPPESSGTHISRHTRLHRFPLKEARVRNLGHSEHVDGQGDVAHTAISYKRRKDVRSSLKSRADRAAGQSEGEHDEPFHTSPRSPSRNELETNECANSDERVDSPAIRNEGTSANFSSDVDDLGMDIGNTYDVSLQDDARRSPRELAESEPDSDDEEMERFRLDRKRRRLLHRMMPAVWINRLEGQTRVPVKRRSRSRSRSGTTPVDDSNSGSDEDNSLLPGQSRRNRSGIAIAGRDIKGDSESSESGNGSSQVKKDVLNVQSSSDSDAESANSLDAVSEDDSLERSIIDAGYFDHDFSRQHVRRRREEPLIDFMLSRTRTSKTVHRARKRSHKDVEPRGVEGHNLRVTGLDIHIPKSPTHSRQDLYHPKKIKQTLLTYDSTKSVMTRVSSGDFIDLTNMDMDPGRKSNVFAERDKLAELKKHPKKQRRETMQKGLYTVTNHGRQIHSGRKRGFMKVQVDMADDNLHQALRPRCSDGPLQIKHSNTRKTPSATQSIPRRTSHQHGHDPQHNPSLKQTSLHDFAADGGPLLSHFDLVTPVRHDTNLPAPSDWQDGDKVRTCSLDMKVAPPTPGLTFGPLTYLGRQLLPELLSQTFESQTIPQPRPYDGFGLIDLNADVSAERFAEAMDVACNLLSEWLEDETVESTDIDNVRCYERLTYSICHFAAWMYANTDDEGRKTIHTATSNCASRLADKLREKLTKSPVIPLDLRSLEILWFNVELMTRMSVAQRRQGFDVDFSLFKEAATMLIDGLVDLGMRNVLKAIEKQDLSSPSISLRAAELWVCLVHLFPRTSSLQYVTEGSNNVLWSVILQVVRNRLPSSPIEASERLWRLIFSLSALSHFSPHGIATSDPRLQPCWEMVGIALDSIRLTHDGNEDLKLPREILKRRDKYVRMVVARCFILEMKWKWPLCEAYSLFKKLVDIFRSRNFANLLGEEAEFPAFLRYHQLRLLGELRTSDTAFSLYLKLVAQAAKANPNVLEGDGRAKSRVSKLLSLTVPLSGVAFSKTRPPTTAELPMLINRFSTIVIAILVEGIQYANIRNRVSQCRRFINFSDADDRSREVCIKAAMHVAIAASHLNLSLEEPLKWLGDMCQTLVDEFQDAGKHSAKDGDTRKSDIVQHIRYGLVIKLQLLLRCVSHILEQPTMGGEDTNPRYPDIGLLDGPWVKGVFPKKELTNVVTTRDQILQLVRSFLKAREQVIPPPRRPAAAVAPEDNSESQDMYGEFGFDDDTLACLPMEGEIDEKWKKDKEVAEIMNAHIVPHIFRLLLQYFNDPSACPPNDSTLEDFWEDADHWIDCWVGCAAVVVRNQIRSWEHYLTVGPQSWGGISDSFFRRRVAVRFMYQLLRCDPPAYNKDNERHFLVVFLQSLVAFKVTMESEYLSILFTIDGLRHSLFRNLPVDISSEKGDFHLSRLDFFQKRQEIILCTFSNLDSFLTSKGSELDKNVLVECIFEMLSALRDIWTNLVSNDDRAKYAEFCRFIFATIKKYGRVQSLQRLATYVAWGTTFETGNVNEQ